MLLDELSVLLARHDQGHKPCLQSSLIVFAPFRGHVISGERSVYIFSAAYKHKEGHCATVFFDMSLYSIVTAMRRQIAGRDNGLG